MKFSIIYEAQTDTLGREADYKIFTDIVEQVMLAEELGFRHDLGGRAHGAELLRAHECPRDLSGLHRRTDEAHRHRPRCDLLAGADEPSGQGGRAVRDP